MKKDEWVATLKPGDKVAVRRRFDSAYDIYRVASVTPSGRVRVALDDRFSREFNPDGWLRGGDAWSLARIEPVTQHVLDSNRKLLLLGSISKAEWGRMDLATLEKIVAMLPDEAKTEGRGK